MSQSIFYKVCSHCMAQMPFNAAVCDCGQPFECDRPSDNSLTAEVMRTETEERLYEAYLEARLQQMMSELRAVREECGPGKWTPEQLAKTQHMLRAVEEAKKDLAAQREKSAQASEVVHTRKTRKSRRQITAAATPATAAAPVLAAATTAPNLRTRVPVPDMPSVEGFSATPGAAFRSAQTAKAQRIAPAAKNVQPPSPAAPAAKTAPIPEFELRTEEYAIAQVIDGFRRHT